MAERAKKHVDTDYPAESHNEKAKTLVGQDGLYYNQGKLRLFFKNNSGQYQGSDWGAKEHMAAKDNLTTIHAVDGAILSNQLGKAVIRSETIGLLNLPTGEIVMADPTRRFGVEDYKRKAFYQKVNPGFYPVVVYSAQCGADRSIAFAEIRFSNDTPVSFVVAKTICDTEIPRRGFCGYVVNDGTTGFMDADTFKKICSIPKFGTHRLLNLFDDAIEENEENLGLRCAVSTAENGELSAALLSAPSGIHYWFWGKDRKNKICCLIADFFSHR